MVETKMNAKPLGGQRQQRSADTAHGLSEADRAHLRSGGRIACEKQADGSTTKRYTRGMQHSAGAPSSASTRPARKPSKAELQAIHDRWLGDDAQLLDQVQRTTLAVDYALDQIEQRRRGRQ